MGRGLKRVVLSLSKTFRATFSSWVTEGQLVTSNHENPPKHLARSGVIGQIRSDAPSMLIFYPLTDIFLARLTH